MGLEVHVPARVAALLTTVIFAVPVAAHAQSGDSQALFQKGAAHYQAEEYEQAALAFEKLYVLEPSTDVLFAWAQAERFADNCAKAIQLFEKLLDSTLSERNREAVKESMVRCNARLEELAANQSGAEGPQNTGAGAGASLSGSGAPDDAAPRWYKDPIGGALTATGVVSLGLGIGFYISGRTANSDAESTRSASDFARLKDRAQSRGRIGYIGIAAGTALVAGGVAWYILDPLGRGDQTATAWLGRDGGGIAVRGSF